MGVNKILVPGIDLESCWQVLNLLDAYQPLYGAVGVHPNSGDSWNASTREVLSEMTQHPKVVAIGEIGLDYYRDRIPRELQKEILLQQLSLASQSHLPAVLHVRNRSEEDRTCIQDLLEILDSWVGENAGSYLESERNPGVIHSFSGDLAESRRAREMGFLLGVTGPITYKNAEILREVVRDAGLSSLLIETDGPFLTPQQQRGKRNEPAHVRYIVDKISEVTGLSCDIVAAETAANADRIFNWERDFD
jgi:TatD DNase family protein